jgi:CheY-like chemotaxis protein
MPKLLIADGSPMMHRIMELTFAQEGMQVVSAADGEQAMALLPIAQPDVVIADHALSGRNGYEIAAFMRERPEFSHIPVLLLASPFEPLDQARAAAAGVAGEISKPFDPGQLVSRVRGLLSQAAAAQAPAAAPRDPQSPTPLKLVDTGPAPSRGALDDYFDRLDAALERLDEQFTTRGAEDARRPDPDDLPTLEQLLASDPPPRAGVLIDHPLRNALSDQPPADGASLEWVDAGSDMPVPQTSVAEESDRELAASAPAPAEQPGEVSEALVDEVTRRVLERLAPGVIDGIVADVVTRVAERLLREEIAKLKH